MVAPRYDYTPSSYDESAASALLADPSFIEAFCEALQLLGTLLVFSPKTSDFQDARRVLQSIDVANDWPFGSEDVLAQVQGLLKCAQRDTTEALVREYTRLFRGPARLPAPPWGSVYMDRDRVMYGWTWVELRNWMRSYGFVATYEENDPEDHLGRLLLLAIEVMREKPELLCTFLGDHVLCWSSYFLELLDSSTEYPTYKAVAMLACASLEDIQDLLGITPAQRKLYERAR